MYAHPSYHSRFPNPVNMGESSMFQGQSATDSSMRSYRGWLQELRRDNLSPGPEQSRVSSDTRPRANATMSMPPSRPHLNPAIIASHSTISTPPRYATTTRALQLEDQMHLNQAMKNGYPPLQSLVNSRIPLLSGGVAPKDVRHPVAEMLLLGIVAQNLQVSCRDNRIGTPTNNPFTRTAGVLRKGFSYFGIPSKSQRGSMTNRYHHHHHHHHPTRFSTSPSSSPSSSSTSDGGRVGEFNSTMNLHDVDARCLHEEWNLVILALQTYSRLEYMRNLHKDLFEASLRWYLGPKPKPTSGGGGREAGTRWETRFCTVHAHFLAGISLCECLERLVNKKLGDAREEGVGLVNASRQRYYDESPLSRGATEMEGEGEGEGGFDDGEESPVSGNQTVGSAGRLDWAPRNDADVFTMAGDALAYFAKGCAKFTR